jgi:NADH dehydrogenase (ubiquinone) Fe-S protein 1
MMIVGRDALTRKDSKAILNRSKQIANELGFINTENGWNGYNVLQRSQGEINALELGLELKSNTKKSPKVVFLLGCDNNISLKDIPKDSFVVYIGCHGDEGAQFADIILPAAAYTERSGTYGNFEFILSQC